METEALLMNPRKPPPIFPSSSSFSAFCSCVLFPRPSLARLAERSTSRPKCIDPGRRPKRDEDGAAEGFSSKTSSETTVLYDVLKSLVEAWELSTGAHSEIGNTRAIVAGFKVVSVGDGLVGI